jgi:pectinesterase
MMSRNPPPVWSWIKAALLLLALVANLPSLRADSSGALPPHKIKIVLVGDSTVNDGGGWGWGFKQFLTDDAQCINTAANGRSSKSFIAEGKWQAALALKGDYYLIQFGHNDEPGKGPDRETDPNTTYTQNLARYVDDARAIGAKAILVTSLTRRNFDPSGNGKLLPCLVPYVAAMKNLAQAKNVPLIDLHARSIEYCEKIGPAQVALLNPLHDGKPDTTHLNAAGRLVFGRIVIEELRKAAPELAPYLLAQPDPSKAPKDTGSSAQPPPPETWSATPAAGPGTK